MTRKNTKRALAASLLSLLLCCAMLVGTTFAWFTDSVKSGDNKIIAGSLKADLIHVVDGEDISLKDNPEHLIFDYDKWEPGYTVMETLKVANKGDLAFKFRLDASASGATAGPEGEKLADVIDVYVYEGEGDPADTGSFTEMTEENGWRNAGSLSSLMADTDGMAYGVLLPAGATSENGEPVGSVSMTVALHMQESAGNGYQGLSLGNLSFTLSAAQYTYESDAFGNQYDVDAEYPEIYPVYPNGITDESFVTNNAVAVDGDNNYYTTFTEALSAGGTIYLKENADVPQYATHPNVTKDLVIYANGATFNNDISIGTYAAPENNETNVTIYNAKNLTVWGQPTGRGNTWNVTMIGCENSGRGLLMYRYNETSTDKINFTAKNCKTDGYTDSIVHTSADGSITITDCEFSNNCAPVNIAHKQSGEMSISVENCTFRACGKINPEDDYFAPARFVENSTEGSMTVLLKNNTFVDTIGTNGDILLGDYRTGKSSQAFTAVIETKNPVMVKSSAESPYSFAGGTIAVPEAG